MSSFVVTVFTCFLMCVGSIMITHNTDVIIIEPVSKMVGIIKTLADDPLRKPEEPQFTLAELQASDRDQLKTVELSKTIYRMQRLL